MEQKELANALQACGCTQELQEMILNTIANGDVAKAQLLIKKHRCTLMQKLHEAQKPVDLLDYVLHSLKNQ